MESNKKTVTSTKWHTQAERGSKLGIVILFYILDFGGYRLAKFALIPVVGYFFITGGVSRRASLKYLRALHIHTKGHSPSPSYWNAFLHHYQFALNALDKPWLWKGETERFKFQICGKEKLNQYIGKGVVVVGAHIGNFDALRVIAEKRNIRVNVIMYRNNAQKINAVLNSMGGNLRVIELVPGDVNTALDLEERLLDGEMVALLCDRLPPNSRAKTQQTSFLNDRAEFPINPWIFCSLMKRPVLFAIAVRQGALKYTIYLEEFLSTPDLSFDDRSKFINSCVRKYSSKLEKYCILHPLQWFNFFDFWKLNDK